MDQASFLRGEIIINTLVTGVAGFIGSHLAEELLSRNYNVIGIDNFTDYYSTAIKKNNIKKLLNNKKFTLIKKDMLKVDFSKILQDTDVIFHEAAQPGVRKSWGKSFTDYLRNNILATQYLLEQAKTNNTWIIFASSLPFTKELESRAGKKDKTCWVIPLTSRPYLARRIA